MVRSHNEDSIAADAETGLAVLADGMGGYNAGEVASGIAVAMHHDRNEGSVLEGPATARTSTQPENRCRRSDARDHAEGQCRDLPGRQSQPQYAGMGTTLVVALFA